MLEQLSTIYTAGKNLLSAIHQANIELVTWLTAMAGVTLAPEWLTAIDIGLLFSLAFGLVKIFVGSMKHAAIIAGAVIALIVLLPIF